MWSGGHLLSRKQSPERKHQRPKVLLRDSWQLQKQQQRRQLRMVREREREGERSDTWRQVPRQAQRITQWSAENCLQGDQQMTGLQRQPAAVAAAAVCCAVRNAWATHSRDEHVIRQRMSIQERTGCLARCCDIGERLQPQQWQRRQVKRNRAPQGRPAPAHCRSRCSLGK